MSHHEDTAAPFEVRKGRISFAITYLVTMVVSIFGAAWWVQDRYNDMRSELADLRRDVRQVSAEQWTFNAQNSWAGRLRWENRKITDFTVPEPREFRQ